MEGTRRGGSGSDEGRRELDGHVPHYSVFPLTRKETVQPKEQEFHICENDIALHSGITHSSSIVFSIFCTVPFFQYSVTESWYLGSTGEEA